MLAGGPGSRYQLPGRRRSLDFCYSEDGPGYNIASEVSLPIIPESNYEEISDNLKLRGVLQNNWPVLFKIVKVKKDKNI